MGAEWYVGLTQNVHFEYNERILPCAGSLLSWQFLFLFFCYLYSSAASSQICLMSEVWQIGGESLFAAWHPISLQHRPAAQSTVQPTKCPGRVRKPGMKGWRGWEESERRNGGREPLSWREVREITVHRVRLQPCACTNTHSLWPLIKHTQPWTHCVPPLPSTPPRELISQLSMPFDRKHQRKWPRVSKRG